MTQPQLDSEDRRRPKALVPYVALWLISLVSLGFVAAMMLSQG